MFKNPSAFVASKGMEYNKAEERKGSLLDITKNEISAAARAAGDI